MSKVLIADECGPYQCRANDLATQRDAFKSDVAALHAQLDQAKTALAERDKRIREYEESEASVCPEDVGFVEFIGVLQKRIAGLERALIGVTPSHRVKGKCWCPIAVDTGVTHSKACQAARAALAAPPTAAVEAVEGMRRALRAWNKYGKYLGPASTFLYEDACAALAAYEEATRG